MLLFQGLAAGSLSLALLALYHLEVVLLVLGLILIKELLAVFGQLFLRQSLQLLAEQLLRVFPEEVVMLSADVLTLILLIEHVDRAHLLNSAVLDGPMAPVLTFAFVASSRFTL